MIPSLVWLLIFTAINRFLLDGKSDGKDDLGRFTMIVSLNATRYKDIYFLLGLTIEWE